MDEPDSLRLECALLCDEWASRVDAISDDICAHEAGLRGFTALRDGAWLPQVQLRNYAASLRSVADAFRVPSPAPRECSPLDFISYDAALQAERALRRNALRVESRMPGFWMGSGI